LWLLFLDMDDTPTIGNRILDPALDSSIFYSHWIGLVSPTNTRTRSNFQFPPSFQWSPTTDFYTQTILYLSSIVICLETVVLLLSGYSLGQWQSLHMALLVLSSLPIREGEWCLAAFLYYCRRSRSSLSLLGWRDGRTIAIGCLALALDIYLSISIDVFINIPMYTSQLCYQF